MSVIVLFPDRQVEIIFFSMPTPAATARSYSSGTVAESWSAMPVESNSVISSSERRPCFLPVMTSPISPAMSSSRIRPLRQRHVDLAVGAALADIVDEDARALQDRGLELLVAGLVGADRGDVRAGRDPLVLDERAPRGRHRDHHVGAAHHLGEIARAHELGSRYFGCCGADELIERRLRAAPDAGLVPGEDRVAGGKRALRPCDRRRRSQASCEFLRASHFAETAAAAPVRITVW